MRYGHITFVEDLLLYSAPSEAIVIPDSRTESRAVKVGDMIDSQRICIHKSCCERNIPCVKVQRALRPLLGVRGTIIDSSFDID